MQEDDKKTEPRRMGDNERGENEAGEREPRRDPIGRIEGATGGGI